MHNTSERIISVNNVVCLMDLYVAILPGGGGIGGRLVIRIGGHPMYNHIGSISAVGVVAVMGPYVQPGATVHPSAVRRAYTPMKLSSSMRT